MSVPSDKGSLELEVTNFGPIVEAKIDLRPFTLFVGPSNTGKSYLAILIYTLHRLFSGYSGRSFRRRSVFGRRRLRLWQRERISQNISNDIAKGLFDWVRELPSEAEKPEDGFFDSLPDHVATMIRPMFGSVPNSLVESEINRCFGLQSTSSLVRSPGKAGAKAILRRYVESENRKENPFAFHIDMSPRHPVRFSASIPEEKPLFHTGLDNIPWMLRGLHEGISKGEKTYVAREVIDATLNSVTPYLVDHASLPAHYLPADRTGVMHAHRVVVGALVERAASAGIHPASPMPMLSGVLADFLEQLIALGEVPGRRAHAGSRQGRDLATLLERSILGGEVRRERSEEPQASYPSFSFYPQGWKESLPLMRASSMVSELAPVVLYLRYVVQPGDVLIIEEPESHLHPAMQVEFTRVLAAAARSGIRIIMTTHSEWILEELANLVRLSTLPVVKRKTIDGGAHALAAREVGAWLFQRKKRPKGSVVQEIPLDPESGGFDAEFGDVGAALHNRWAEISSRMEES